MMTVITSMFAPQVATVGSGAAARAASGAGRAHHTARVRAERGKLPYWCAL